MAVQQGADAARFFHTGAFGNEGLASAPSRRALVHVGACASARLRRSTRHPMSENDAGSIAASPLAGAGDGWMAKAGTGRVALGVLVIAIGACGEPGLENVPPGWERAKVITLRHEFCGVDYESEMSVSHTTEGNQVTIQIKKLSMRCLPIPNPGLSAAIRSQTSNHHEILIHPVDPPERYESCNCRTDVEAVFELGTGNHQIDFYTWTMWGEDPWKATSVNVSL